MVMVVSKWIRPGFKLLCLCSAINIATNKTIQRIHKVSDWHFSCKRYIYIYLKKGYVYNTISHCCCIFYYDRESCSSFCSRISEGTVNAGLISLRTKG